MPNLRDKVIEAIFDALPSDSYEGIAEDVGDKLNLRITSGDISNALTHLRRNSAEYGWTVPHVKRGTPHRVDRPGRFFAVLVDRDGHYELDANPDSAAHMQRGALATAQHAATMLTNETAALRIAATNTRSVNARARINDLADDFSYVARKAIAVARDLRDDRAA
jgi:hypothetical protein